MKIRMGFITNSSSTNFLIISKQELTEDYLFKKLGFVENGKLSDKGHELCKDILCGIDKGRLKYFGYESPTYDSIKEIFGSKAAEKYIDMDGAYSYWGYTSSDDVPITQFFTSDSFEVDEKDFYINGRSCIW